MRKAIFGWTQGEQQQSNSEAVNEVLNGPQVEQEDLSAIRTGPGRLEVVCSQAVDCRQALGGYGSLLESLHANTGGLTASWVTMEAKVTHLLRGIRKESEATVAKLQETNAKLD